ncbi:MAG: DUF4390 domain-containing protein, partial [bacterium]
MNIKIGFWLIIISFVFFNFNFALKTEISIPNLKIESNHVYISAFLKNGFTPEIKTAINNGIQSTFKFSIELREKNAFLFFIDKKIKTIIINHQVFYNALEKKYIVKLDEKQNKFYFISNLEETENIIKKIENIPIIPKKLLLKNNLYYIRIKVEINSIELYPPLNLIFNQFTPYWNFATKWK